ncbi:hypothetical protein quinque_009195 [Culex quinquefasciatus]
MDFSALLQQAQKLSHDTQVSDDLPRVERTLTQVLQAGGAALARLPDRRVGHAGAHSARPQGPKISQKLETLSSR